MKPLWAQVSSFILPPSSLLAMRRPERVADILRDEISQIVGYELEDPRITMVTVTDVRLSENLKSARVYVTVAGNEEEHELALAALRKAAPYVRKQVGLSLNLPRTPEIHFVRDRVEEEGERVDKLLDKIERDWASQESKERIKDEFKG
ncbi:MAG: 30S ribosome-binding factor RbfA [Acidobacteriota bacterium]|nr:30S ribosome-binding factor RbfA [Acidobacteriota bacterium]